LSSRSMKWGEREEVLKFESSKVRELEEKRYAVDNGKNAQR